MRKKKLQSLPEDLVRRGDVFIPGPLGFDPLGSYTGVTLEAGERPVQDADDL